MSVETTDDANNLGIDTEFKDIFGDVSQPIQDEDLLIADPTSSGDTSGLDLELEGNDNLDVDSASDDLSGSDFSLEPLEGSGLAFADSSQFSLGSDGDDGTSTGGGSGDLDDVQTKLDLAQAYIDMEDFEGAQGILSEVVNEGNPAQQDQARDMLGRLS